MCYRGIILVKLKLEHLSKIKEAWQITNNIFWWRIPLAFTTIACQINDVIDWEFGTHHHNHFISLFHTTKMWLILSKFVLTSLIISSGTQTSITFQNIPHSPLLQFNIVKFINENWKRNFENMIFTHSPFH